MITINMYGAFDRKNYGDLLFPLIATKALHERFSELSVEYYGTVKSDFSAYGGVFTRPIAMKRKELKKSRSKQVLLIVGGEVLPSNSYFVLQCLADNRIKRFVGRKLRRFLGSGIANSYSGFVIGLRGGLPFILSREDFPNACIIYNTVGGLFPSGNEDRAIELLQQANYLSVREKETYQAMIETGLETRLCPDSATLMSKYFPYEKLQELSRAETRLAISGYEEGYICFQVVNSTYANNKEKVIGQLTELHRQTGLPIVLLPIGTANMHWDDVALKEIQLKLNVPCSLVSDNTIYDTMYLISRAKLFIGTSLHGNITAIAYGRPQLGINPRVRKLDAYLRTWWDDKSVHIDEICSESLKKLNNVDRRAIDKRNILLSLRVEENFDLISDCISRFAEVS